jgi:hypothetical protein
MERFDNILIGRRYGGGVWHAGALIHSSRDVDPREEIDCAIRVLEPGRAVVMRCVPVLEFEIGADGPTPEQIAAAIAAVEGAGP